MYDLLIIGSGPAGVAASIYASRYKISHKIFGVQDGGLISTSSLVDNYPGMEEVSGYELGEKFVSHIKKFNPDGLVHRKIKDIAKNEDGTFTCTDDRGDTYDTKSLLLALGTKYRRLGVPGEDEFEGKGVTWCATCDAFFYREKPVAVIGGGDSALEAAHLLAGIASKVYIVHRRDEFRAEPVWVDMVKEKDNVEFVLENSLEEIRGTEEGKVAGVTLVNEHNGSKELQVDGVFIEIGSDPLVELPNILGLDLDDQSYVQVAADQSTNVPGVYAAGDFTTGSNKFRQVLPAMSEGVVAVSSIYNMLHTK